jgi:hypothetical protein
VLRKHENRDVPLQTKISDLSGTSKPITVRSHEPSQQEREGAKADLSACRSPAVDGLERAH